MEDDAPVIYGLEFQVGPAAPVVFGARPLRVPRSTCAPEDTGLKDVVLLVS